MTRPTMFGMNGTKAMVGGEAGAEAILPLDMLWSKLAQIMNNQNSNAKPEINNYVTVTVNADSHTVFAYTIRRFHWLLSSQAPFVYFHFDFHFQPEPRIP